MSSGLLIGGRRISPLALVSFLVGVTVIVALFVPQPSDTSLGGRSSHSTGPGGTRMVFELAQRMGWQAMRREEPLDSAPDAMRSVHVVLSPDPLGAVEVHRLLENVRQGGGLIFDVEGAEEIADSLGIELGANERGLFGAGDTSCVRARTLGARAAIALPPTVHELRWRRPPPGVISFISVGASTSRRTLVTVGDAFPMGAGRVAALSSSSVMSNGAVRTCAWNADVAAARALEFVRPESPIHPRLVFDEYHHGYGAHGGGFEAISIYLARTTSGHFLAQALIGALVLLLAKAPRPIVPQEPERIPRRSPLEHADALGHAYADVGATRTATSRLVGGLRRRVGRRVPVPATANETAFLDAVEQRAPSTAASVRVVRRALIESLKRRDLAAVAEALDDIERQVMTTPPSSPVTHS